jgi:hypothetical protein
VQYQGRIPSHDKDVLLKYLCPTYAKALNLLDKFPNADNIMVRCAKSSGITARHTCLIGTPLGTGTREALY